MAATPLDYSRVRVLGADESGLVKVIDLAGKSVASKKLGLQSAGHGVTHMTWCALEGQPEGQLLTATRLGVVRLWQPDSGVAAQQYNVVTDRLGDTSMYSSIILVLVHADVIPT